MCIEYNECHYGGMYNVYVKRKKNFFFITEIVHMNAGVSSEKENVKESQSQSRSVAPPLHTHFGCRVEGVTSFNITHFMLVIMCFVFNLCRKICPRNYIKVNQIITLLRLYCINLLNVLYGMIFHKHNISTSYKFFLHWIIKPVTKLILTIANKYTRSCLSIELRPLIFGDMHKSLASKDTQVIIRDFII